MISDQKLGEWCETSTWTIREASYLVNKFDPIDPKVEIGPDSKHPVSQTFYWLKKEEGKDKLFPLGDKNGEKSYSPGTLMRHLTRNKKGVSKEVLKTYEVKSKHEGPHGQAVDARDTYREAAKLVWKQYPDLTKCDVAEALTQLPSFLPQHTLANRSPRTIEKYIKGLSSRPPGRPTSASLVNKTKVNLEPIAYQLST